MSLCTLGMHQGYYRCQYQLHADLVLFSGQQCHRYDEELALEDVREREVKSRAGHRSKLRPDAKRVATWK